MTFIFSFYTINLNIKYLCKLKKYVWANIIKEK